MTSVLYEREGPVVTVTLNRPEALNALDEAMMERLHGAFARFQDDDQARVAVLRAAGERAFCVGADLGEYIPRLSSDGVEVLLPDPAKRFFSDVYKPIVAAVRGHCVGGGLEMLLGTDLRVASAGARFGLGEVRWGVVPAGGSHVRLPRQIPWAIAMELILTGELIDARRAYEVGLLNRVVPDEEVEATAYAMADVLARNSPVAVQAAKESVVRTLALEDPFTLDAAISGKVFESEDAREGPRAFIEKRTPRYAAASRDGEPEVGPRPSA